MGNIANIQNSHQKYSAIALDYYMSISKYIIQKDPTQFNYLHVVQLSFLISRYTEIRDIEKSVIFGGESKDKLYGLNFELRNVINSITSYSYQLGLTTEEKIMLDIPIKTGMQHSVSYKLN